MLYDKEKEVICAQLFSMPITDAVTCTAAKAVPGNNLHSCWPLRKVHGVRDCKANHVVDITQPGVVARQQITLDPGDGRPSGQRLN